MMPELYERNLPLNIITEESDKKKRFSKLSIVFGVFILIILLLFINYSFPSLQNIYGLNESKNIGLLPLIATSNKSLPSNLSRKLSSSLSNEEGVVELSGNVTSMPMRFNRFINSTETPSTNKSKEILLDFCNLTNINPWDSTILKYIKPQKDHTLNCKLKIFQHSKLIDGQLFIYSNKSINESELNCTTRCIFPKGDRSVEFGEWNNVTNGTKPECDVVEIECRLSAENKTKAPFYRYLHSQIYRNTSRLPPSSLPKPPEKYDVHIIVLDSVSQTQFIRSMPKTLHMLLEYYEAVPFRHLNKIKRNSYYNAFAFLMGKMVGNISESPFSRGHIGDYPDDNKICKTPLDDEQQFIGFRYQDAGYVTMMAEDWSNGAFNWPSCKGFLKTPMDHYMRPFQRRTEISGYKPKELRKTVLTDSCLEHHHNIMKYLMNFLKAYPDKPKFSISWMSWLTHDTQNALSSSDDFFFNFFIDYQKYLENSFVFFMGDHGLRFGGIRYTKIGEMEDNNPALFITVPKPLRNDATLMQQLKLNAKELITHYDVYATLNEIAQPKNPRIANPILHGSSLFHPLPYPRTCDSLRIPFEFCNCRGQKTLLPKNNTIGIEAANLLIEQMNFNLSISNDTSNICANLTLNKAVEIFVEDYGGEQALRIYKITFSTLPGNGKFDGTVSYDPMEQKFEILTSKVSRLDSYKKQAKCAIKSLLASYCYCIV